MLTHCDFVYAGESAKFQMPFINLAVVPEFGSSCTIPAWAGYLRAAELILTGQSFDAREAAEIGVVTRVVPNQELLGAAIDTAQKLAQKPPAALRACKRLLKQSTREQLEQAVRRENEEFSERVRSPEAKQAFTAFLEKRRPNSTRTKEPATVVQPGT
jgi:enoyl-CoA hydratase/carnithine racemase